ncbi:YjbQ family protein [candidate division GN15 bacterium]|nr:YjbQ family protein [candidate division GN15 bacterium]
MRTVTVKTDRREQMIDVTSQVRKEVADSGVKSGIVICFAAHTTAAVTINENADPDVTRDILHKLNKEIPKDEGYHHGEGNSDSHIKSSLVGASEIVLIEDGRLVLGRWQGIYFCEFDGPRQREMLVKVIPCADD